MQYLIWYRMCEQSCSESLLNARLHDATKTCDHATCVKIALCKRAYCDMRLSQESWTISTFLRQHATVE